MKRISLSQNQYAIVSDRDYNSVSKYTWHAHYNSHTKSFYARGLVEGKKTFLHRFIMKPTGKLVVHHKNHDTLNNRRCNLKTCTDKENRSI